MIPKLFYRITVIAAMALSAFSWNAPAAVRPRSSADSLAIRQIRERMDSIRQHRPVVGLVFAGGGAKGAAITGVLKYLDSLDIHADLVTGTSIGGLVGAMYSMGYNWRHLDTLFSTLDWDVILSDKLPPRSESLSKRKRDAKILISLPFDSELKVKGAYSGLNVELLISRLTIPWHDSTSFAALPVPFACVAADPRIGMAKIWKSGSLPTAMRSTMSIPALFNPVETEGLVLVDGGLMNNFPSDVAKDLGADIIIAVDLSSSSKEKSAKKKKHDTATLGNVLLQSIYIADNSILRRNRAIADVIIHPDLDGYNLLSFDPEAIEIMTRHGYEAASALEDTLLALKGKLGSEAGNSHNGEGLAVREEVIAKHNVSIGSIEVEGLAGQDSAFVARLAAKNIGKTCTIREIENTVRQLYGSGAFEDLKYFLKGGEEPYKLVLSCKRGPSSGLGVGLRADNEEYISALLDFSFGEKGFRGFSGGLSALIGLNPSVRLRAAFKTGTGVSFGTEAFYKYLDTDLLRTPPGRFREQAHLSGGNLYAELEIPYTQLRAGGGVESFNIRNKLRDTYLSLFVQAQANSLDNWSFPTEGVSCTASYNWYPYAIRAGKTAFSKATAEVSAALTLFDGLCFIPSLRAESTFGNDIPLAYRNFAGGTMDQRYYAGQFAFDGLRGAMAMDNALAIWRAELRCRITGEHYISAIFNSGADAPHADKLFGSECRYFSGAALEYGYNSLAGPLRLGLGWNDLTRRIYPYFTVGKTF